MKILFMGTPDIAASSLQGLINAGHDICAAYTREDKPVGRKQILTPPPVKQVALQNNIPVFQPKSLKEGAVEVIEKINPDLIVVVAYGRILPKEVLSIPKYGCINLHVSLLPKYRGAAPIQWSVINGESETGVTIMFMDEGIDTGDIINVAKVNIDKNDTAGDVFENVTKQGVQTLCQTIEQIENGTATRTPQQHENATLAPPLTKEMAKFSFNDNAEKLHNLIRGLNPWPVAYFICDGKKVKVLAAEAVLQSGNPGQILSIKPFIIACEQGALVIKQAVPEGSKPMEGSAFAAGKRYKINDNINFE